MGVAWVLQACCPLVLLLFSSRLALIHLLFSLYFLTLRPRFPAPAACYYTIDRATPAKVTTFCASSASSRLGRPCGLEFLRRYEWQAALAFKELAQSAVAGTAGATHDARRDSFARLAPGAATAQPIFPA